MVFTKEYEQLLSCLLSYRLLLFGCHHNVSSCHPLKVAPCHMWLPNCGKQLL